MKGQSFEYNLYHNYQITCLFIIIDVIIEFVAQIDKFSKSFLATRIISKQIATFSWEINFMLGDLGGSQPG